MSNEPHILIPERRMAGNIVDGIKIGLMFTVVFSVMAVVVFVISGGTVFDRSFSTLGLVIAAYLVGGIASGALFGLLRPLARWAVGAAILGVVAAMPAYAAMRFAVDGFTPWTADDTSTVLVLSSIIGGLGGLVLRHRLIKRGLWTPK
jgi:hypothetical protein